MRESILDEICDHIGYSATRTLAVWFAGRCVYVPRIARADHPLAALIGVPALRSLVEAYGGERLGDLPPDSVDAWTARDRRMAERIVEGATNAVLAAEFGLSVSRVRQIRDELALRGWLRYAEGYAVARAQRGRYRGPLTTAADAALAEFPENLGTGEVSQEPPGGRKAA